jgi:hypothetical protein
MASVASAAYPYGPKVSPQKNVEIVDLIVSPTTPILDEPIDIVVIVRNNGKSSENLKVVIKSEWWETIEEEDIKTKTVDNISQSQEEIKRDSSWINKWRNYCSCRYNQQNSQPSEEPLHIYHPNYRRLKHQEIIKVFDIVSLAPGESRSVRYRCKFSEVGGHIISARATSDHTSHFDSMSKSITVGAGEGVHDLGIVSVCDERGRTFYNDEYGNPFSAIKIIEGESRAIRVMIKNGSRVFYEDTVVSVKMGGIDGRILGANAVKIGPKEVGVATISLDTGAIKPGTYKLYAEVKPVKGEVNLMNNSISKTLIVEEKAEGRVVGSRLI